MNTENRDKCAEPKSLQSKRIRVLHKQPEDSHGLAVENSFKERIRFSQASYGQIKAQVLQNRKATRIKVPREYQDAVDAIITKPNEKERLAEAREFSQKNIADLLFYTKAKVQDLLKATQNLESTLKEIEDRNGDEISIVLNTLREETRQELAEAHKQLAQEQYNLKSLQNSLGIGESQMLEIEKAHAAFLEALLNYEQDLKRNGVLKAGSIHTVDGFEESSIAYIARGIIQEAGKKFYATTRQFLPEPRKIGWGEWAGNLIISPEKRSAIPSLVENSIHYIEQARHQVEAHPQATAVTLGLITAAAGWHHGGLGLMPSLLLGAIVAASLERASNRYLSFASEREEAYQQRIKNDPKHIAAQDLIDRVQRDYPGALEALKNEISIREHFKGDLKLASELAQALIYKETQRIQFEKENPLLDIEAIARSYGIEPTHLEKKILASPVFQRLKDNKRTLVLLGASVGGLLGGGIGIGIASALNASTAGALALGSLGAVLGAKTLSAYTPGLTFLATYEVQRLLIKREEDFLKFCEESPDACIVNAATLMREYHAFGSKNLEEQTLFLKNNPHCTYFKILTLIRSEKIKPSELAILIEKEREISTQLLAFEAAENAIKEARTHYKWDYRFDLLARAFGLGPTEVESFIDNSQILDFLKKYPLALPWISGLAGALFGMHVSGASLGASLMTGLLGASFGKKLSYITHFVSEAAKIARENAVLAGKKAEAARWVHARHEAERIRYSANLRMREAEHRNSEYLRLKIKNIGYGSVSGALGGGVIGSLLGGPWGALAGAKVGLGIGLGIGTRRAFSFSKSQLTKTKIMATLGGILGGALFLTTLGTASSPFSFPLLLLLVLVVPYADHKASQLKNAFVLIAEKTLKDFRLNRSLA